MYLRKHCLTYAGSLQARSDGQQVRLSAINNIGVDDSIHLFCGYSLLRYLFVKREDLYWRMIEQGKAVISWQVRKCIRIYF